VTDITICSVTAVTDSKARKAYNYFKTNRYYYI